jgi:excisionase family DNA binding protein
MATESTPARSAEESLLLTVPQAARLLQVSRNTAYELIGRGELPAIRLGERLIRIPRFALESWIRRQVPPEEPLGEGRQP